MKRLKPLIGICGAAGSGKDTLASGIAATDVYAIHALALPIKAAINAMFGWTPEQWHDRDWKEQSIDWLGDIWEPDDELKKQVCRGVSPRYLAQTLGTEWGRQTVDQNIWLKIAQQKYDKIRTTAQMQSGRIMGMGLIVPDIRFENEAQWIRDEGGLLFEVERPGLAQISESSHASEAGLDPALIDAIIVNDGPPSKMVTDARRILWESSGFSGVG